jgi:cathepsin L
MMKSYLRVLAFFLALAALAAPMTAGASIEERQLQGRFNSWMRQHARSYDSQEFLERYNIWRENNAWVEEFNRAGNQSFTVAMNKYGDMQPEEVARLYKGHMLSAAMSPKDQEAHVRKRLELQQQQPQEDVLVGSTIPASWDWRTEGAVTPIENQGSCGACWAFTATAALEGASKIANNSLVTLSPQQFVDCSGSAGNYGCSGGNTGLAYNYMLSSSAKIMSLASYPYTATQGTCKYSSASGAVGIKNYASVTAGSESSLLANAAVGPVAVAIDASLRSFIYYSGGYYYDASCTTTYLDHAVTVVGWGTDATYGDYWLAKNQWGTSWGDAGYVKMARNRNNNCGIASLAVRPCLETPCSTTPNTSFKRK